MLEEKYKQLDPYGDLRDKVIKELSKPQTTEKKFQKKQNLEDYKDNSFHNLVPFSKPQRRQNSETGEKNYYGVENIKSIVNHDYEKDFLESKAKKEENQIITLLMREQNLRGMDTKASVLRNKAIMDKIRKTEMHEKSPFRLKQFEEAQPSSYISTTTKEVRKRYATSTKRSNIEKDSVLKVANLMSNSERPKEDQKSAQPSEEKQIYIGEKEVETLSKTGMEVHRFDMRKNQIIEAKRKYPNLGVHALASRFNLGKNPYKGVNQSMDLRSKTRRNMTTMGKHKTRGKNLNRSSLLPEISYPNKKTISQIRKDEGEYSKLLSNHANNRLVQAQRTVDDALRKYRSQNPNKNQRERMVSNYFSKKRNMNK